MRGGAVRPRRERARGDLRLHGGGAVSGALAQIYFGAETIKPTRMLTNIPGAIAVLRVGMPTFDDAGRYAGPLPSQTPVGNGLIGKRGNEFATNATAEWPDKMCEAMAKSIVD